MPTTFEELLAKLKADPENARLYAVQLYELGWEERGAAKAVQDGREREQET